MVIGGIVGSAMGTNIKECFNAVNINVSLKCAVGGIVGNASTGIKSIISDCYNEGNINFTGSSGCSMGGIIGNTSNSNYPDNLDLRNCYNIGYLSNGTRIGGIIGHTEDNLYKNMDSYYLSDCGATNGVGSGQSNFGIYEKSGQDMKKASIYEFWDKSIWEIKDGDYPKLKNTPEQ